MDLSDIIKILVFVYIFFVLPARDGRFKELPAE